MTANEFKHVHSAHCESGVMASLLRDAGMDLSEAMTFGLTSSLSFAYLPFVKIGGMPLVAYRSLPRSIIKNVQKNLNVKMELETFSSQRKGQQRLDELLEQGKAVGSQTSVFWLPYFPEEMRFHFNAHNLVVFGKQGDDYLISDPVFETPQLCDQASLTKARFIKGVMAPKGLLYYVVETPSDNMDLKPVIRKSIHKTAKTMLKTPVPIAGLKGMRALAKSISKLANKDKRYAKLFLGHIVRMQEEIGTGGAGFRFLYASFLQEASDLCSADPLLQQASKSMLQVGDKWREFALIIAQTIKSKTDFNYQQISDKLLEIADDEAAIYRELLEFPK